MKTILVVLLIALVSTSSLNFEPVLQEKQFSLGKFLTCVKNGVLKDENLPAVFRAFNTALNTKNFTPLFKLLKEKLPTLLQLATTCYATSVEEEVVLKNFFGDIGKIAVGAVKEIGKVGKAAWKEVLGGFKTLFENKGKTLLNDLWNGVKSFAKNLWTNLKDSFVDLLKNSILTALVDPKTALQNFTTEIKDVKGFLKNNWPKFEIDGQTKLTVEKIKDSVSKVPSEVRSVVNGALDQGRNVAMEKCKALIGSTQKGLCKFVNYF